MQQIDEITGKKNFMGVIEQLAEIKREEGREEGKEETKTVIVKNLLSASDLSMDKIASIVGVSLSFVKMVRDGKI